MWTRNNSFNWKKKWNVTIYFNVRVHTCRSTTSYFWVKGYFLTNDCGRNLTHTTFHSSKRIKRCDTPVENKIRKTQISGNIPWLHGRHVLKSWSSFPAVKFFFLLKKRKFLKALIHSLDTTKFRYQIRTEHVEFEYTFVIIIWYKWCGYVLKNCT